MFLILLSILGSCTSSPENKDGSDPGVVEALSEWNGSSLVRTAFGRVQGFPDKADTWVWKAIPYALPPVGDLRWRAPRQPDSWEGVLKNRRFAGKSTQFSPVLKGRVAGSEDCLYLNIWRPQTVETELPVYVWIHGGGNSIGSSTFVPDYYGYGVASKSNMVFVSVNYRLGPFGWFSHPALREGSSPEDDSGNYGTLDLIQSLLWIRHNIAAFGGNPDNVIITGESAGAFNALSLMISPPAKGLFSAVMSQSGGPRTSGMEDAYESSNKLLVRLLIKDRKAEDAEQARKLIAEMPPEQIRAYLRSKTDREILKGFEPGMTGMTGSPAILRDGYIIPESGYKVFETAEYNKAPLIIGTNKDETKLFLNFSRSFPWKSEMYQAVGRYGSDLWKVSGADSVARVLSSTVDHPPVYVYQFAWGSPNAAGESPLPGNRGMKLGAFHSLEVPFFLGTDTINGRLLAPFFFTKRNEEGRKSLSNVMMSYVANLVRSGDPNDADAPYWPAWSSEPGGPKYIIFDVDGNVPDIRMSSTALTEDDVFIRMKNELSDDLYVRVERYLRGSAH